jgi:hypothetical protein
MICLKIIVCLIGFLIGRRIFQLLPNPNAQKIIWPAVGYCRSCESRIWTWQKQKEVKYPTHIHRHGLKTETQVVVTGIVHEKCKEKCVTCLEFGVKAKKYYSEHFIEIKVSTDLDLWPQENATLVTVAI